MAMRILAVGKKMPSWVETAFVEYQKRMPAEFRTQLVEISAQTRAKNTSVERTLAEEAEKLQQALKPNERLVVLDVKGQSISTEKLASRLEHFQMESMDIAIIIGSADGIAPSILNQAQESWSLSKMTFPHPLVRVILMEQLYRAAMILRNHPYHRA